MTVVIFVVSMPNVVVVVGGEGVCDCGHTRIGGGGGGGGGGGSGGGGCGGGGVM